MLGAWLPRRKGDPTMDGVSHFEIAVDDKEKAKAFYASVFGWQIMDLPVEMGGGTGTYTLAMTTDVDEKTQMPTKPGAINGALIERTDKITAPVVTINVASIDDALGKVVAAGGAVVEGKLEIPGMGAYAYVSDVSGNVIGLWETFS
jgi:predicted enzyme related to lactoylglutathione lyase